MALYSSGKIPLKLLEYASSCVSSVILPHVTGRTPPSPGLEEMSSPWIIGRAPWLGSPSHDGNIPTRFTVSRTKLSTGLSSHAFESTQNTPAH